MADGQRRKLRVRIDACFSISIQQEPLMCRQKQTFLGHFLVELGIRLQPNCSLLIYWHQCITVQCFQIWKKMSRGVLFSHSVPDRTGRE